MHDSEFEKRVQQKMEELEFSPSPSVWKNVEEELEKEKERKRPLSWFLLFAVIGITAGIYFYSNTNFHSGNKNIAGKSKPAGEQNSLQNAAPMSGDKSNSTQIATAQDNSNQATVNAPEKSKSEQGIVREAKTINHDQLSGITAPRSMKNTYDANAMQKDKTLRDQENKMQDQNSSGLQELKPDPDAKNSGKNIAPVLATNPSTAPADKNSQPPGNKNLKSQNGVAKNGEKPSEKKEEKSKWKFGFTANAGISTAFESAANGAPAVVPVTVYTASFAIAFSRPTVFYYQPSAIRPGPAFGAGIYVERVLGKKLSLVTGLNYRYISTQIQTGKSLDSGAYYASGSTNNYTNQYHFLELPLNLQYQFAHVKKIRLAVEGGATLSQLLATNALHYDYNSNLYRKDKNAWNSTQVHVEAAVLARFGGKHFSYQLGPAVQYGISKLNDQSSMPNRHLFYGGIKFVLIP